MELGGETNIFVTDERERAPADEEMERKKRELEHARIIEARRHDLSLVAPTIDIDVRRALREYEEPMTLFGEGPYERRTRLRKILADRTTGESSMQVESVVRTPVFLEEKKDFFTEGSAQLYAFRKKIALLSVEKAQNRLENERNFKEKITRLHYDNETKNFADFLTSDLSLLYSQVGDERPLNCIKFSPDGDLIALGSWRGAVSLWDSVSSEKLLTSCCHKDRIVGLSWNPTRTSLGNTVKDYARNVKQEEHHDDIHDHLVDYATCSADTTIKLWSSTKMDIPLAELTGHEERVNRLEFHPTSPNHLISTSHDESWRVWDIEKGVSILTQEGHAAAVYPVKIHPDGALAITGDLGGIVRVTDLRTGRTVMPLTGHTKGIVSIDIHPVFPSLFITGAEDHTIRVWDLRNRRCLHRILPHDRLISEALFEPQHGRFILTSSHDKTVKVWSSADYVCCKVLHGHQSKILGADCFSSKKDTYIASVSYDRTWNLFASQKEIVL